MNGLRKNLFLLLSKSMICLLALQENIYLPSGADTLYREVFE